MNNYIRSEVYRIVRAKGTYIFAGILIGLVVLMNIVLWIFGNNDLGFRYNNTKFAFSSLYASMQIPLILSACMVSVIVGKEYKENTLKNTISFGIPRSTVYFGRLIINLVYGMIITILVAIAFVGSAYMLLDNSGIEHLNLVISALVSAIPIFIFSVVLTNALYLIVDRESSILMIWVSIVIVIPRITMGLGLKSELCRKIANYMPLNILSNVNWGDNITLGWTTPEGLIKVLIASIVGIVLFYAIGLNGFKKKEIK